MDDLLDLDFSKPNRQSTKPSAQSAYSGRSAFDYLAQSNQPSYRTPSPATQPIAAQKPQQGRPQPTPSSDGGGDAFAGLFGTSAAASSAHQNGLSMAERSHKESAHRIAGYEGLSGTRAGGFASLSPHTTGTSGAASRASSPALQPTSRVASPSSSLLTPTSASSRPLNPSSLATSPRPAAPTPQSKPSDPWNFDLLGSAVPTAPPVGGAAKDDDPFDLGFDSPSSARPSATVPPPAQSGDDDFDLFSSFSAPAPPSRPSPAPSPAPSTASPAGPTRSSSPPPHIVGHLVEMGFPPPRARAALLSTLKPDGNWDAEAAVDALVSTSSPSSAPAPPRKEQEEVLDERERRRREKQKRDEDEWGEEDNVRVGRRRSWEFEDDEKAEREARERDRRLREREVAAQVANPNGGTGEPTPPVSGTAREKPARATGASSSRVEARRDDASPGGAQQDPAVVLQQQATAALAQAQKLGFSMFKTANQMWGQGKEALQKVVDEQRAAARVAAGLPSATGAAAGGRASDGRPKWWREGMDEEGLPQEPVAVRGKGKQRAEQPASTSFKDSDDEGASPNPAQQQPSRPKQPEASAPSASEYRSPFRRAKATPSPAPTPPPPALIEGDLLPGTAAPPPRSAASPAPPPLTRTPPSRSPASPSPAPSPRHPSPSRPFVPISPSSLSNALSHKIQGNAHFKLGRFGDASSSYSLALDALPAKWIGRVPLLNNRAQARLRSGEEKLASEDCSEALDILLSVCPSPAQIDLAALEAESTTSLQPEALELAGGALDLKDHLGKALGRRAKAFEASEKWKMAGEDWDKLLKLGDETVVKGAGGRKLVNEGAERCRKMLGGGSSLASARPIPAATAGPKPAIAGNARARPPPRPVQGSGEAVRALQASNAALAAEDDLRHSLKDSVDARILAWKGGKETNLRALIASLENVLWPELGWKKVGMHELISEGGLKVRYVRAIGKVHPDKLNANNTTVEQRMIAGLVFAALNDAWNAQK
ncbi:hypothetical protein JCM11641_003075 [Rhodosporidiobolus odoratus]